MKFSSAYEPDKFEAEIYAAWEASGVFKPSAISDGAKTYSIVMPPPNANGNLHIGHGLTVALEDSLTRYHRLRGESTWYVPGADHAGFETWVVYERALEARGKSRFQFSREELYAQVWDFVQEQKSNMELQVRQLGASCDWSSEMFTLDESVVRRVYATFEKMWNDGFVYRGEKLVNYCPKHQTAFADIEVEHVDEKGKLWDIAYPVASPAELTEIIVSTTRPETLFGDTAVAVNPSDERYADLIGSFVHLPLTDREIPIIADEHADPSFGTGAVKITPAHDYDDFEVGERHDLPRVRVIDDAGLMTGCGEEYDGLSTAECRKKVLKNLKAMGLLRGEHEISHSVAHCYKCGTVIEPTLKEQWFIDVKRLAEMAIEHISAGEIKFFPASKKKVLINYLRGLKDWNISRQIPWGIAIPMFHRADLVAAGPAADKTTLPDGTPAPEWVFDSRTELKEIERAGVKYIRDEDTFDTWFSSSHWPIVCTGWEEDQKASSAEMPDKNPYYPLNVMETGADILFAWVARMIMMGVYVTGEVPFREVYLHGLVLDAHGQKMSKSKGNVLNPVELVSRYGSDAFRLGILRGRSAGMNQAFSENSVAAGRNLCNKLWNMSRLIQSFVDDVENSNASLGTPVSNGNAPLRGGVSALAGKNIAPTGSVAASSTKRVTTLNSGEDWICREIDEARKMLEKQMREYRFSEAVETLYSLVWDKYADWFLESQKIYKNVPLLKRTLCDILVMIHPFAPFVTEAIWQNLSFTDGMIIEAAWPSRLKYDPISASEFEGLIAVISEIRRMFAAIPGGKKWPVLFGDDSLVDDNQMLVQFLTKAPSVVSCEGQPRGIRLALAGREVYLDVPDDVVSKYAASLEERILSVGRELDGLNARMMNPRYVDKAPAELVEETRRAITEKEELIARLKLEREAI